MAPWQPKRFDSLLDLIEFYRAGGRPRLDFVRHSGERYLDMGITQDEVADAVMQPDHVGHSRKHRAMLLEAGRITVSVCLDSDGWPVVVTILFRYQEDWEAAYRAGTTGRGRAPRDLSHLKSRAE